MDFLRWLSGHKLSGAPPGHRHPTPGSVPGWEAISDAADQAHPGQEPLHWGTIVRWRTGGPDPLDGVSAYRVDDPPHWHYVSYGLSELYQKESEDSTVSGWGVELTMRLARDPADSSAPRWPVNVLQNLARYIFQSGNVLLPGHTTDAQGTIALDEKTDLDAFLFVEDSQLASIRTPHGRLTFVQVVGITDDEYRAAKDWSTDGMVGLLRVGNPLLVTDLRHRSIRTDPAVETAIREGIERDGSSMTGIKVDVLEVVTEDTTLTIRCGALGMHGLRDLSIGRTGRNRAFWVDGPDVRLAVTPGPHLSWHRADEGAVHVEMPPNVIEAVLESVPAIAGTYTVDGNGRRIQFEVAQTIVRDGKEREIGRIG
jgi:suppressor of fused-like protein